MSDDNKLIESFLKMHNKGQLNEAGGVNFNKTVNPVQPKKPEPLKPSSQTGNVLTNPSLMNPSSMASRVRYQGALASGQAKPVQPNGEMSDGGNYNLNKVKDNVDTFVRSATGNVGDVVGITDPKKSEGLRTFNPKAAQAGDLASAATMLMPGRSAVSAVSKLGKADDAVKAAGTAEKVYNGEVLAKGTKLGDNAINATPSTSTAVAKTTTELKPRPQPRPATSSVGRPNAVGEVGQPMKTVNDIPPRLNGPTPRPALPSPQQSSSALGGFGKVPMGKVAAVGAGVAAGAGAATVGSKPAGEQPAAAAAASPSAPAKATSSTSQAGSYSSRLSQRTATDKAMKVAGVERQNQIAAPGTKTSNLRVGSKGDDVKDLQQKLGIKADGIFGPQTAAALKAYQTKNKLKVDGIAGDQTMSSFKRNQAKKDLNLPEETTMTNKFIDAFLKLQERNHSNIFEAAKKLDKVGKEDGDIDNDGDSDSSDSYLKNRRKKIAKAMKEAKDPYGENDGGVHKIPPREMTPEEKPKAKVGNSVVKQTGKNSSEVTKSTNEEVTFSDEELAHIEAVLYEEVELTEKRDPNEPPKKRGRKPGVKIGSYKKKDAGGEATSQVSVPHVFHQIRSTRPQDGNYHLQHDAGTDEKGNQLILHAKVPAAAAASYHNTYLKTEKPRDKEALTNHFVDKHFSIPTKQTGGSKISLPAMPKPKS